MGPTGPNALLGHSTSSFSSSSPSSSIRVTSSRPPRVPRWLLFGTLGDRQKGVKDKIPDGGGSGWSGPHILGSDHPSKSVRRAPARGTGDDAPCASRTPD